MSVAERDLRRLQQQLQDALAKGAPDAEIERLTQELKEALDRYLRALAQEMQQNPDRAMQPLDPSQVVTGRDLQRMVGAVVAAVPVTSAIASWIAAASGEYDQTLPQLAQRTRRPSPTEASATW